jgi:hypothetical protein
MGSFYGNVTLLDTDLDTIRAAVDVPAFVAAIGGDVVVFSASDDEGSPPASASQLSATSGGRAISALVHDDDILFLEVFDDGALTFQGAVPDPAEVFGEGEPGEPIDAAALVGAVGRGDVSAVATALATDVVFATELHHSLCEALSIPTAAVGWGHRYLEQAGDSYDGPPLTDLGG